MPDVGRQGSPTERFMDLIRAAETSPPQPQSNAYTLPTYPAVKARPRPIPHTLDNAMFHGIVMNVIKMAVKVFHLFNRVFPKTGLPDSPATLTSFSG